MKTIRVGIVGAGTIVPEFLKAAEQLDGIELVGICGLKSDEERLQSFSEQYQIPNIYYDYDQMLGNADINMIYVAVPNHLHYLFGRKALEAGKHLILEKPFTVNCSQAKHIAQIAEEKHLYVFEAITLLYNPNFIKVQELVSSLGDIKILQIHYSQYSRRYDLFKQGIVLPAFDAKKAGGALMDLNVYNIHFAVSLLGEPESVNYYANIKDGIDTSGVVQLHYPDVQCILTAAKDSRCPISIGLQGEEGYIHSTSPTNIFEHFSYRDNHGVVTEYSMHKYSENFSCELSAFLKIFQHDDYTTMRNNLNHSILVCKILENAQKSAGLNLNVSDY